MSDYFISQISPKDKAASQQLDRLLTAQGIRRSNGNLDYTCGMFDEDIIYSHRQLFWQYAPVSGRGSSHQGEGLI